jgi:hypothetical protein
LNFWRYLFPVLNLLAIRNRVISECLLSVGGLWLSENLVTSRSWIGGVWSSTASGFAEPYSCHSLLRTVGILNRVVLVWAWVIKSIFVDVLGFRSHRPLLKVRRCLRVDYVTFGYVFLKLAVLSYLPGPGLFLCGL